MKISTMFMKQLDVKNVIMVIKVVQQFKKY